MGSKNAEGLLNGNGVAHYKLFMMPLLIVVCALFYYLGELVDWATWDILRSNFFHSVHDIHRLLFLVPIIYAAYTARVKGALIVTIVAFVVFLPRAFFISPYPDSLLRMVLFTVFAGVIGTLVGVIRNQALRHEMLENVIAGERDKLLKIVSGIADGIIITGPDYKIRFMNAHMRGSFGEGAGVACYKCLQDADTPCAHCRIEEVINKRVVGKWGCSFPNGSNWEVVAAPYEDADGTTCQISMFREITERDIP